MTPSSPDEAYVQAGAVSVTSTGVLGMGAALCVHVCGGVLGEGELLFVMKSVFLLLRPKVQCRVADRPARWRSLPPPLPRGLSTLLMKIHRSISKQSPRLPSALLPSCT